MNEVNLQAEAANLSRHKAHYRGFGMTGAELDEVVFNVAADIEQSWADEFDREDQTLNLDGYSRIIKKVQPYGRNVLIRAYEWSTANFSPETENEARKQEAGDAVVHFSLLRPSVSGTHRISKQYPDLVFDELNLVQEGVLKGWRRLSEPDGLQLLKETYYPMSLSKELVAQVGSLKNQAQEPVQEDQIIDPDEWIMARELEQALIEVLETLPLSERGVIVHRFGLFGRGQETLAEVARMRQVSDTRIRQIEAEALIKLKSPFLAKKVRDFYPDTAPKNAEESELNGIINALVVGNQERAEKNAMMVLQKMWREDLHYRTAIKRARDLVTQGEQRSWLGGSDYAVNRRAESGVLYYKLKLCLYALEGIF